MAWIDLADAADLRKTGKLVVRHQGRQILLMETKAGLFACLNRCPHEGYPLREGTLVAERGIDDATSCVLTCQWHNWKFDLVSGETLVGGDRLTRFPIREVGGRLELDIVPEDPAILRARHLANLNAALTQADDQRIVREAARILKSGGDFRDVLRQAVFWSEGRLEFGTTHAWAAAPDWLALASQHADDPETLLVALGEILCHLADDTRAPVRDNGGTYPFAAGIEDWDPNAFLAAIEAQDEGRAVRLLRGGLMAGVAIDDWQRLCVRAALAHYADFGHALIYSVKTADLIHEIGPDPEVAAPLLCQLIRALCFATREDLIPEFRAYGECRARWGHALVSPPPLEAHELRHMTPRSILPLVTAWSASHEPEAIFACLLEAAAWQLLQVDEAQFQDVDAPLADNVGWLDFTHALTFAQAGLQAVWDDPRLWPDLLLQLACFVGRNACYTDPATETSGFAVDDTESFWPRELDRLLDHGRGRFIISAHLMKTLSAASQLAISHPEQGPLLAAALNRFLQADIKERHARRNARQMLALVAEE